MSSDEIKKIIGECCNDVIFSYHGKASGVTSEVKDYIPVFQAWHGDEIRQYDDIEDVMTDCFYSGYSLNDIADDIEFEII